MFLALALTFLQDPPPIWQLGDAIQISGMTRGGRVPFPQDDLLPHLGEAPFKVGDVVPGRNNSQHKWVAVEANDKGVLAQQPQGGYVQAIFHSDKDQPAVLTISGDGGVYFNGELRPGDVYGYGYLSLPVHLLKGDNTLLIAAGRGSLSARLEEPMSWEQQFNLADTTMPDVLTSDTGNLMGGVVVLNCSDQTVTNLRIRASVEDHTVESKLPEIGPYTLRKVPFNFPALPGKPGTKEHVELALLADGKTLDTGHLDLDVFDPFTTHKRTFISKIDGSLQYYAVVPAKKPSKDNALVLTLHGASVEAIGQARAYQAKDWCTIVAPTNRRPYGFDWEDIGRLDALEVLDIAKKTYPHDPARVDLTGHSMGGHGTWSIGTLYPNLFASIAPSAGWISFQSYAGGFSPSEPTPLEKLFLDVAEPSDTLGRVRNTLEEKTYILHGAVDDNVPVTEARTMKKALTDIGASFEYHEQPGANHWWGNQCVDWPPLFEMIESAKLKAPDDPSPIDFTTPNPQVSSTLRWITVVRQIEPGESSVQARVHDGVLELTTRNVAALEVRKPKCDAHGLVIDGYEVPAKEFPMQLEATPAGAYATVGSHDIFPYHWLSADRGHSGWKNPERTGGFKLGLQNGMIFVYGTSGPEKDQLYAFARSMAEKLYYQGNGAADVWTDQEFLKRSHDRDVRGRNVVLFGNTNSNLAWSRLLAKCPISPPKDPADEVDLITYPLPGSDKALVLGLGVTGERGIDVLERLPLLSSGAAYPDWVLIDVATEPTSGIRGVDSAGNFGPDWKLESSGKATK